MKNYTTCAQEIGDPSLSTDGHLILCHRECQYVYSKRLRDAGAPASRRKFCAAHLRLRRLYGPDSPDCMRPVDETRGGVKARSGYMERHGS